MPQGQVPEWATAVAIAGLAALITGPMLRAYDKKNRDREAIAEQSDEPEPPMTQDLKL
jgi:Tfp pilus assembly major pilin PilA